MVIKNREETPANLTCLLVLVGSSEREKKKTGYILYLHKNASPISVINL